jgi:hypothetical protein
MRKGSLLSTDFYKIIFPASLYPDLSPSISPKQGNKEEKYEPKFYIHPK